MGTTALTLLQRVATSAGNMKLFVVLSTASLAACMPAAQLRHPGLAALVPVGTHQWPGITTGAVDKTCFGCRPAVVAAIHGRKRRDAEPGAEAEAEPEAEAEAEPEADAAAAAIPLPAAPLYALNGYAHSLPGNSYSSISTPNLYHALPHHLPVYPLFG